MTDTTPETEGTETPETDQTPQEGEPTTPETEAATDSTTAEADPGTEPTEDGDNPSKEAAKYRRRLREAEKERDGLRGQLEAMQRAAVESLAGKTLRKPEALWAAGVELADVLDQNGKPDAEKVATAARTAADQLGLARALQGNYSPREGNNPRPASGTRFEDALRSS